MTAKKTLALELNSQGQIEKIESSESSFSIGRSKNCRVSVPQSTVLSREHLKVQVKEDGIWITDLNSSNGTFLQGEKLIPFKPYLYPQGNKIFFGTEDYDFSISIAVHEPAAVSSPPEKVPDSEVKLEPQPELAPAPEPVIDLPEVKIDERLMQMQLIEDEIAHLTQKRQALRGEVDLLASREEEFRKLQLEFDKNQVELVKTKADLEKIDAELDRNETELKSVQEELEVKRPQLKAQNAELEACRKSLDTCLDEIKSTQSKLAEVNQYLLEKTKNVEDLDHKASELRLEDARLQQLIQEQESKLSALDKRLDELESQKEKSEQLFAEQSARENAEIIRLSKAAQEQEELHAEAKSAHERFQKRTQLEIETFNAESKLRKATLECEVEEALSKKAVIVREMDDARHFIQSSQRNLEDLKVEQQRLIHAVKKEADELDSLRKVVDELTLQKANAEVQLSAALKRSLEVDQDVRNILKSAEENADSIHRLAIEQKEKLKTETLVWVNEQKSLFEKEQAERLAKLESRQSETEKEYRSALSSLEAKRIETEKLHAEQKEKLVKEFEEAKAHLQRDHDALLTALKEKANEQRNQHAEELRLWLTEEEGRVKKLAVDHAESFAHQVSMRALSNFQPTGSVAVETLITVLEKKIVESLTGQVQDEGIYNPNLKKNVRSFWIQASAAACALLALACGIHYGPQFIGKKLDVLKISNQKEDARFMEELKHQRDLMLALNLQERDAFQEHYVDNVLYNRGYLAMKLDSEVQKLWTVELSKFFFEELLFDDRKVVDYMPIEASLISSLNETYKVLNSQNFDVNLAKMKKIEEVKTEEMWLLVGGRDNWVKLRKRENEFYSKHLPSAINTRIPAGK